MWSNIGWILTLSPLILAVLGIILWLSGGGAILKAIVEVITPLARGVADALVAVVSWAWRRIIRPGAEDILDNAATLILVTSLILGTHVVGRANWEIKEHSLRKQISQLQTDLKKARKPIRPAPPPPPIWEFKWPF